MSLLLPLGLLALAAWALPLLLHLARREQQQPVEFAALRWLGAKLRPRQRLRFEEVPLLLVRLALLAALALLLAMPVRDGDGEGRAVVAVHPALAARLPAGLGEDAIWLAPGFPRVAPGPPASAPDTESLPVFSLLRELDASLASSSRLSVHVPARLAGADAARPRLSRAVDWRVHEGPDTDVGTIGAAAADAGLATPALSARIELIGEPAQLRWLRLALLALAGEDPPQIIETSEAPAGLGERIAAGTTAVLDADAAWPLAVEGAVAWRDEDGQVLARSARHGDGFVLQWQRPLRPDALPALLEPDFPHRLYALLKAPPPAPTRIAAAEASPLTGGPPPAPPPQPLDGWLIAAVLALFALERWLAGGPRLREAV